MVYALSALIVIQCETPIWFGVRHLYAPRAIEARTSLLRNWPCEPHRNECHQKKSRRVQQHLTLILHIITLWIKVKGKSSILFADSFLLFWHQHRQPTQTNFWSHSINIIIKFCRFSMPETIHFWWKYFLFSFFRLFRFWLRCTFTFMFFYEFKFHGENLATDVLHNKTIACRWIIINYQHKLNK